MESALRRLDSDERVWIHSDFHMGNAMVLSGDRILCMDTALDMQDHPYRDVGKFLADIQSPRAYTLGYEVIPTRALAESLRQRFLRYLQDALSIEVAGVVKDNAYSKNGMKALRIWIRLAGKMPHWVRRALGI
jgi:hypothetical protein